jgi:hypothetical protein
MKTTIVILSVLVVILLAAVGALLFLRGGENGWLCQNGQWVKHGRPADSMPQTPCGAQISSANDTSNNANQSGTISTENNQTGPIGGQKDEHGCLTPAGYSWCEAKQKCLRPWEENCPSDSAAAKGTIEGSLGYPSEGIPPMEICAEETKSKKLVCTEKIISNKKYTFDKGYQLEVPAGTYRVFAKLSSSAKTGGDLDNYKAYYSQFVTCGMNADCLSHLPIDVKVKSGETKTKLDPIDWYNMQ